MKRLYLFALLQAGLVPALFFLIASCTAQEILPDQTGSVQPVAHWVAGTSTTVLDWSLDNGQVLSARYVWFDFSADEPVLPQLKVQYANDDSWTEIVPATGVPVTTRRQRFWYELEDSRELVSLGRIGPSGGRFKILAWGFEMSPGFVLGGEHPDRVLVPVGTVPADAGHPERTSLIGSGQNLHLYWPPGTSGTVGKLSLGGNGWQQDFTIVEGPMGRSIMIDSVPGPITWISAPLLQGRELRYQWGDRAQWPEPLIADFGTILDNPPSGWRSSTMELYQWSVFPDMFIIAFRNYRLQSEWLGRLAFYLEKQGYRGRILSDREISGLHDWNAHNYSAEGLADFFTRAFATGIPLRSSENELLELVLKLGVIAREGETYRPLKGGLLSLAFDPGSNGLTRELLMGHEGLHGIYYAIPELREASHRLWNGLSNQAKEYMQDYFAYNLYDTSWDELMINEFQAYLLQQSPRTLSSLVQGIWLERILGRNPQKARNYHAIIRPIAEELLTARGVLARIVFDTTGLIAPELSAVSTTGPVSVP